MMVEDVWCDDILEVLEKLNLPITIWTMDYGLWTRLHNLINHRVTHILLWSKECGQVWSMD